MRILTLGALATDPSVKIPKKGLILLAYLAERGPSNRYHLADLMWGDRQEMFHARHSLRQLVLEVSKAAPVALAPDLTTLRLAPGTTSDISEFRSAGDHHAAARLYRGPFLDGADVPPPLEDWLSATRQEIDDAAHDAFCSLVEDPATRPNDALSYALRALRIDGGPRSRNARNAALERAGRRGSEEKENRDPYKELTKVNWRF